MAQASHKDAIRDHEKWRQPFTSFTRPEDLEMKTNGTAKRGERAPPAPTHSLLRRGSGQEEKRVVGGRRKPLIRLDSAKEIKGNPRIFP
jgi:hypothetical protein